MNILQYDLDNYNIEDVEEVVRYLNHHGFKTIAIPKDFTLLLDCDRKMRGKFDFPLNFCYNNYIIKKGEEKWLN